MYSDVIYALIWGGAFLNRLKMIYLVTWKLLAGVKPQQLQNFFSISFCMWLWSKFLHSTLYF